MPAAGERRAARSCLGASAGRTMPRRARTPSRRSKARRPESHGPGAPPDRRLRESLKAMSENETRSPAPAARGEEQLRRAAEEFEARLAEFADLAARVRHEINNPLTGLIGQAQLLPREELSDTAPA